MHVYAWFTQYSIMTIALIRITKHEPQACMGFITQDLHYIVMCMALNFQWSKLYEKPLS